MKSKKTVVGTVALAAAITGMVFSGASAANADGIGGRGCTGSGGTLVGVYYSAGDGGRSYETLGDCGTVGARSGYQYNGSSTYYTGWVYGSSQAVAADPPYTQVITQHKATNAALFNLYG